MPTKITVDFNAVKVNKEFGYSFSKARKKVKSSIVRCSDKFMPFNKGELTKSVVPSMKRNDAFLIWNKVYARFLYEGKVMVGINSRLSWAKRGEKKAVTDRNISFREGKPNSGSHWFEKAKEKNIKIWIKIYGKGGDRFG